jgi:hypothetical protein
MKLRESLQAKKKHKVKGQVLPHFTTTAGFKLYLLKQ